MNEVIIFLELTIVAHPLGHPSICRLSQAFQSKTCYYVDNVSVDHSLGGFFLCPFGNLGDDIQLIDVVNGITRAFLNSMHFQQFRIVCYRRGWLRSLLSIAVVRQTKLLCTREYLRSLLHLISCGTLFHFSCFNKFLVASGVAFPTDRVPDSTKNVGQDEIHVYQYVEAHQCYEKLSTTASNTRVRDEVTKAKDQTERYLANHLIEGLHICRKMRVQRSGPLQNNYDSRAGHELKGHLSPEELLPEDQAKAQA